MTYAKLLRNAVSLLIVTIILSTALVTAIAASPGIIYEITISMPGKNLVIALTKVGDVRPVLLITDTVQQRYADRFGSSCYLNALNRAPDP